MRSELPAGVSTGVGVIARLLALSLLLAAAACAPDDDQLVRSFNARWEGETAGGGMMIRLRPDGTGVLNGLDEQGEILGRMDVQVQEVSTTAETIRLQRTDTGGEFVLARVEPAADGRSRIRIRFTTTGRPPMDLVFAGPLPSANQDAGRVSPGS